MVIGIKAPDAIGQIPGAPPEVLARVHFVGASQLAANREAATLKEIWNLAETRKLWQAMLDKLAAAPDRLFQSRLSPTSGSRADLCRPFFVDLVDNEFYADVRTGTDRSLEWTLAIHLADDRAALWHSNLTALVEAWDLGKCTECKVEDCSGWEVRKHHVPNTIRWVRSGAWFVLGLGQDRLPHLAEILREIRQNGHPQTVDGESWFSLQLDSLRLMQTGFPLPRAWFLPDPLPVIQWHLTGRGGMVRTRAAIHFAEAQPWALEPWHIPTHTFGDPMISFTAVQGFSPWLKHWSFLSQMGVNPTPNQLFIWAQPEVQFQTFFVAPVPQVTNLLERLGKVLPSVVATNFYRLGEIRASTNRTDIIWAGLPAIVPFLCAAPEPSGEFLLGGLFPSQLNTNPPPAELLAQISGRTNLVYYDWEITQDRLWQVRILSSIYDLVAPVTPQDAAATNTDSELPAVKGTYSPSDFVAPQTLAQKLIAHTDKVSEFLWLRLPERSRQNLAEKARPAAGTKALQALLAKELNPILQSGLIYDKQRFAAVKVPPKTLELVSQKLQGEALIQVNRLLLAEAYPQMIANGPWLAAIGPKLGNSVTEATVVGPKELDVVRKSYCGFTALELVILDRWLQDPRFPLFGYQLAPHFGERGAGKAGEKR